MAYSIDSKLKVAVSSRALFQLEDENKMFCERGKKEYEAYQVAHENDTLAPGAAFPLVKALLELGDDDVEVIVVSRNTCNTSLRVFNSINAHGLNIVRGFFTGGEDITGYLKALDIDLFLTANDDSARKAIDAGIPAATMITSSEEYVTSTSGIRIAFDGDAVLFSDETEAFYRTDGLDAFNQREAENAEVPMEAGPMAKFLKAISRIQEKQREEGGKCRITTALVTSRSAPAHARVIKTLRSWGLAMDQAYFLGGLNKNFILKEFKPQLFLDDQHVHTDRAATAVPSGTVPYKTEGAMLAIEQEY